MAGVGLLHYKKAEKSLTCWTTGELSFKNTDFIVSDIPRKSRTDFLSLYIKKDQHECNIRRIV